MKIRQLIRKISPFAGILFILTLPRLSNALDSPRELLFEVNGTVTLYQDMEGVRTGLPDLDAILSRYTSAVTSYALHLPGEKHQQFRRFLLIRLPEDREHTIPALMSDLAGLSSVRWAQPNRMLKNRFIPNDPLYNDLWGLQRIHAAEAWDVTLGDASVPIAIIDTGCEMDHPDLVSSIWRNIAEAEGTPGLDDDLNGFIDDSVGWDFVDAPTFPTSGDYLVRDNDPSDEMGHGTAVAGIAGAVIQNGLGIAGAAPSCPLMILRAGNMTGFLQEDDVASALLYALDNGARIANLSFGDIQVSPMLEDVVNYAVNGGLLIVAAAGNSGTSDPIYPASFGSILSVGACNENDERTTFSSYGTSLDLLAPGINILSTTMGHDYGMFLGGSGTSYAAPFACAVAGLVMTLHPDWDQSAVKSVLTSTTDDIESLGWDQETGHGILRADKAVQVEEALIAEITQPEMEQGLAQTDHVEIIGTAAGIYLQDYTVYSGVGVNPATWNVIKQSDGIQIFDGLLATWTNEEPLDTAYTIRLLVTDIFGIQTDDRVVAYFDPSPPIISNITLVPILDADRLSYLLSFSTDDLTTGKVWLLGIGQGETWISQSLGYEATEHTILLGGTLPAKEFSYSIWVENAAGLIDSTSILGTIDLTEASIITNNFVELPSPGIPPSWFLEDVTDLDDDGFLEVWADTLDVNGTRSSLRIYEATSNWEFADLGLNFGMEIPKSIGDSDVDSLPELLTLYAGRTKIFEATEPFGFPQPTNAVWADSGDIWGAKLLNLIPGTAPGEVVLVTGGVYQIWQNWNENLSFQQYLPNPVNPTPISVAPYCRVNDYDDDGLPELLFGDYQGSVYSYERQPDGAFVANWSISLPLLDTGQFLAEGDFNADGLLEIAVLAHTETEIIGEHLADTRYWALYIFQNVGDNQHALIDTLYFFGAENPSDFASGISAGDVYGDSEDEILLCLYPDFYVVDWDSVEQDFGVIWYYPECESNQALIGDFDRNGHNDILFSTGSQVKLFEETGTWSAGPPPPLNFSAEPEDDRVNLSWSPIVTAEAYNLYRTGYPAPDSLQFLIEITDPQDSTFTDFDILKDSTYYYAISTFDQGGYQSPDGPKSVMISATPNEPPYVLQDTAKYIAPNFVTIDFSEAMGLSFLNPNNYWIVDYLDHPNSIVSDAGDSRAVLTFDPVVFTAAQDTTLRIVLRDLYDLQGSPLLNQSDTVRFQVPLTEHALPYLMGAVPNANLSVLTLVFSVAMDSSDLAEEANYSITADPVSGLQSPNVIIISSANIDTSTNNIVQLSIHPDTPIGALGKIYRVKASNLHGAGGNPIDTTRNVATLSFSQPNLRQAFVYPNPYRNGTLVDGEECVVFSNLTQDVEIRILSVEGILIKTLRSTGNISGGLRWYLDNERGEKVGSGVYLYYASGSGDTFWGKLAVVR